MIDLRLIREDPNLIAKKLERRGLKIDLTPIQFKSEKLKEIEEARSKLQAKGNQIGREVGQRVKEGLNPSCSEVMTLRKEGNEIKQKVALIEEEEKILSEDLKKELLNFPNIPSAECPLGINESENKEIRRWGNPRKEAKLKEHWEIAYELELFDTERSARISKSRFVTLLNQGARLERLRPERTEDGGGRAVRVFYEVSKHSDFVAGKTIN